MFDKKLQSKTSKQSERKAVWLITLCLVILSTQPKPDGAVWAHVCERTWVHLKLRVLQMHLIHLSQRDELPQNLLTDLPERSDKSSLPKVPSADFHGAQSTSESNRSFIMILGIVLYPPGNTRREELATFTKKVFRRESHSFLEKHRKVNECQPSACSRLDSVWIHLTPPDLYSKWSETNTRSHWANTFRVK